MTTLREAAQQALSAIEDTGHKADLVAAASALRAALEQPEPDYRAMYLKVRDELAAEQQRKPEPVAWRYKPMIGAPWSLSDDAYYVSCKRDQGYIVEPFYAVPPITQTAIEKWKRMANIMREYHKPLSDQALWAIWDADLNEVCPAFRSFVHAARAVEAAHGIKDEK